MRDIAIKVENLSKLYQLGEVGTGTLSKDLNRWWAKVRDKEDPYAKVGQVNDRTKKADSDFVWALKDINFEVKKGEVLGIIGKNGAGKSTLLKILSKITSPTYGKIYTNGRIASLLEVGTGFHPEMTGRENIYLNGAILGMRKWEIDKKFDEIVDFAGVEAYIETPVKRYSSGMYVRLAFAVAAFLEPEILIVDEVLAVGDAEFQKKCLGRMKDVSDNEGRTILFVSHNIEAIRSLCKTGILLQNGFCSEYGLVNEVIDHYTLKSTNYVNKEYYYENDLSKKVYIKKSHLQVNGKTVTNFINNHVLELHIWVGSNSLTNYSIELLIKDQFFKPILFSPIGLISNKSYQLKTDEISRFVLFIKLPFIATGLYYIDLMLVESGKQFYDYVENALFFSVESNYMRATGWEFSQHRGQGAILLESVETKMLEANA